MSAAEHGGGGFALLLLALRQELERLSEALRAGGAQLLDGTAILPGEMTAAWHRVTDGTSPLALSAGLLAILGAAFLARHLVRARLAGGAADAGPAAPFGRRLGRACWRALIDLLGLGAFAVTSVGLSVLLVPDGTPLTFVLTYVSAALVTLAAALLMRFALAPDAPGARLLPLGDPAARFLHRWLVTLAAVGSTGWLSAALLILSGMQLGAHLLLALGIGTAVALLLAAMILQGRGLVAAALVGDGATPLRTRIARSWHVCALAYLALIWALWSASIVTRGPSGIWSALASVGLAVAVPLLDRAFGRALEQILGGEAAVAGTVAIGRRVFRIVLAAAALALLPSFWGIDLLQLIGAPGAAVFYHALFNVLIATLVAYVAWQLAETALERLFGGEGAHGARARTLRPLLRKFVLGSLGVVWVMIALSAVGIDIGPLLAGAGVVGIALGFGAQTLVRDVVSGIFFLLDDAFRVGEYVEAGALKGTVEAISLRSLRLRHHRGAVHTVPYGELKALTNHSRDWVIVKLELLVTYDTDVDQVKAVLKQIGKELAQDPELGPNLIEPLKSQGIMQLADHGVLVRAKFTAKPGEQFLIRREAYRRIKLAFDQAGIQFAYPTVTINGSAAPAEHPEVQAAARLALARSAPASALPAAS